MNLLILAQQTGQISGTHIAVGGGILFILFMIAGAISFLFWIWMIVDCATNNALAGTEKIVWLLVVIFLHVLGALIYFFAGRPGKKPLV